MNVVVMIVGLLIGFVIRGWRLEISGFLVKKKGLRVAGIGLIVSILILSTFG